MKQNEANRNLRHQVLKDCGIVMLVPVLFSTLAEILGGTLSISISNTLGQFADAAFSRNLDIGLQSGLIMILCILAMVVLVPGIELIGDFVMLKQALHHDNLVFGRYLDKDPEQAVTYRSGELQYELEDAPNMLRIQWVILLSKGIAFPICLAYFLYCAGKISWLLTGVLLLMAMFRLIVPVCFRKKLAAYHLHSKAYESQRQDCESDMIQKPYLLKIWGVQGVALKRLEKLFFEYYQKSGKKWITCQVLHQYSQEIANHITLIAIFLLCAVFTAKGSVTPGQFTTMLVYLSVAQNLLKNVGDMIQNFPILRDSANRVCKFYQDVEPDSGEPVSGFSGLTLRNAGYSREGKVVFQNLSFSISPGEKVAVLGKNGSGKTTLIRILCTLLKNYAGSIRVGIGELKDADLKDWRKQFAYAPQIPYLFQGTVRENILLGNPLVPQDQIDRLMEQFGIISLADREINRDVDLSGGEKQKISILRALIKPSALLILDEPTNHLDQNSIDALREILLHTPKSVLLVTHDLCLTEGMDKVVKL